MPSRAEWARGIGEPPTDHVYHWVAVRAVPLGRKSKAACGRVDRFFPRVGVRGEDHLCPQCLAQATREMEAHLQEEGWWSGEAPKEAADAS